MACSKDLPSTSVSVFRAPEGNKDVLSSENIERYLSLLSGADVEVVQSPAFDQRATALFRAAAQEGSTANLGASWSDLGLCLCVRAPAFDERSNSNFRAAAAGQTLDGPALSRVVLSSLDSLPEFQAAMRIEFENKASISHTLNAFNKARGGSGGVAEEDFSAFVRFCLAYRIHCYFETSCLTRLAGAAKQETPKVVEIPKVVFALGGPAASKAEHCDHVCKVYGYRHLKLAQVMAASSLGADAPSDVVVKLLQQEIRQQNGEVGKFLVSDFPRDVDDLKAWESAVGSAVELQFSVLFTCQEEALEGLAKGALKVAQELPGAVKRVDAQQSRGAAWKELQAIFGPTVIFLLGAPGCGGDVQAERISRTFGFQLLSAGDLLRQEQEKGNSALSKLIESHMKEGTLVPAEVTIKLLLEAMQTAGWQGGRYLIDGFPRSLSTLQAWEEAVKGQVNVKFTLYLEVCEGFMEGRLLEASSDRSEEYQKTIRTRFMTFHKETIPVVERCAANHKLRRVDAEKDTEEVWRQVRGFFGPSIVFVLGGPGAGKGTQCARIAETFGYTHLSAGDLLREERNRPNSEKGAMIETFIKEGKLVPAEVIVGLLQAAMESHGWEGGRYLIDGFPRGAENHATWDKLVGPGVNLQFCLYFSASEAVMTERLLERGKTSGRSDDNAESIKKRFVTFREESLPVIKVFGEQGKLRTVDAGRPPDAVWNDVWRLFAPTVIFVIGGPGAGKGTQCDKVATSHGFHHLATGDLLRAEQQQEGSPYASVIDEHIRAGTLVPPPVVLAVLKQAIEVRQWVGGRYLLDGFPRSLAGLELFQTELGDKVNVPFSLYFQCPEPTMRSRLLEYGKFMRRVDDSPEMIDKRLQNFADGISPVLERLTQQWSLRILDSSREVEEVHACVEEVLHDELDQHLRNRAIVLIKPDAAKPQTVRFVQSFLTMNKIAVLHKREVSKEEVEQKDLFNRQYSQILKNAEVDPATLDIPQAKQERFEQVHGLSWKEELSKGHVLSAQAAIERLGISGEQLFQQIVDLEPLKLAPAVYLWRLPGKFFVVNAFALHWRETFFLNASTMVWMLVEFDPATLPWERFRTGILGATDPARAAKTSIRGQLFEHWKAAGLDKQPSPLFNGVHASDGPLAAMYERMLWTGNPLEEDPLGRLLMARGIPKTTIKSWLDNEEVQDWPVGPELLSGPIYNCTQFCDTAVFRDSAMRYMQGKGGKPKMWPVGSKTLSKRLSLMPMTPVASPNTGPLPKAMTIIHFNDVYNVEPREKEPVGGIARFVTRVEELKKEAVARGEEEAVVLFSGDAFNPSITSTSTRGKHMVPALNRIGIHTACFGNHDFDFGVDTLVELSSQNNFPWLISNVRDKRTGQPLAGGIASRILDFHGRRIGLMGLVEREWLVTLAKVEPEDIDYEDFCPCARRLAKELKERQGAEMVIALTHMRMPNDFLLAHEVSEVDLILGGHDHHYEVHPEGPHGTYVLNSGTDFRDLTEIRIEFTEEGPRPFKISSTRHVEITGDIGEDPEMKVLVDNCISEVKALMDVVLGETAVDLDCRFASIRTRETNIGNFVSDVMRNALKTDVAILNSGTLRADSVIEKGPFKMRDLVSLLPMLDELCVLQLSGQQLLSVLENAVSQYPRLEGRFAQVSGATFVFDAAKPSGERVVRESIQIGGAALDTGRLYKVCTKDYLRQGKDGYDVFREAVCLADGEQAGVLPSAVTAAFQEIQQLNGLTDSCPLNATHHAGKALGTFALERVGNGPDLMKQYAIAPKVEGRITCLNPVES